VILITSSCSETWEDSQVLEGLKVSPKGGHYVCYRSIYLYILIDLHLSDLSASRACILYKSQNLEHQFVHGIQKEKKNVHQGIPSTAVRRTSVRVFCISGAALRTCSRISSTRLTSCLASAKIGSIVEEPCSTSGETGAG